MSIKMKESTQKSVATVVKMLMLRGSRSHVNDIAPTRANTKPREVRKTQRKWHRANSSVGGCV
jgi:hypothetical protein